MAFVPNLVGQLIPILEVCPKAPPGAQKYADDITGYVIWAVVVLFGVALVVAIGGIVAGRIFSMPHASKAGVVGIFVVVLSAIVYVVGPGMGERHPWQRLHLEPCAPVPNPASGAVPAYCWP